MSLYISIIKQSKESLSLIIVFLISSYSPISGIKQVKGQCEINLCVVLTINKMALSNCSEILSAIFSAHGVGLSRTKTVTGIRTVVFLKYNNFTKAFQHVRAWMFGEQSGAGNSPTIWYTGIGLIVSHYPLLGLWTPNIHLKTGGEWLDCHTNIIRATMPELIPNGSVGRYPTCVRASWVMGERGRCEWSSGTQSVTQTAPLAELDVNSSPLMLHRGNRQACRYIFT